MSKDFKDRPTRDKKGAEVLFDSSTDMVHDDPIFNAGDRVEFTIDYPSLPNIENVAAAGDAATILAVVPGRSPIYSVRLDSEPESKWPRTVDPSVLAAEGSGLRGRQKTKTVLVRGTGELRRF
jgi:hypothetical protein